MMADGSTTGTWAGKIPVSLLPAVSVATRTVSPVTSPVKRPAPVMDSPTKVRKDLPTLPPYPSSVLTPPPSSPLLPPHPSSLTRRWYAHTPPPSHPDHITHDDCARMLDGFDGGSSHTSISTFTRTRAHTLQQDEQVRRDELEKKLEEEKSRAKKKKKLLV